MTTIPAPGSQRRPAGGQNETLIMPTTPNTRPSAPDPRSSITVLDISIDDLPPEELLDQLTRGLNDPQPHWLATVNNEGLLRAERDPEYKKVLQQADWRTCDSIGLQWAAHYQRLPWPHWLKVLALPVSLLRLLFQPTSATRSIQHRYPGRQMLVDLIKRCADDDKTVFFLGGDTGVSKSTAAKAQTQFPSLKVAGHYEGTPHRANDVLAHLQPSDVLFVAYGQPKQELFIARHLERLQTHLAIGVGGSFDYYVGAKRRGSRFRQFTPPKLVGKLGLEWAWRLVTQPDRFWRVLRAVWGFGYRVATAPMPKDL